MWSKFRRLFSNLSALLRLSLHHDVMRLLPLLGRELPSVTGRWLNYRFKDGRKLSFAARGRRSELEYSIYLPSGCSRRDSLPVVVMLHGCQQTTEAYAAGTRMNELAERHRFMVLYPQQGLGANGARCWNWFDSSTVEGTGEAGLIAHLVQAVVDRYPVDATRIYLAGMSAGGAMVAVLAACHGRQFAAAAIHSGLMYRAATSVVDAPRAMREGSRESPMRSAHEARRAAGPNARFVPMMIVQGDRDTVVHPDNAQQIVEQSLALAELMSGTIPADVGVTTHQSGARGYQQHDYRADGRVLLRRVTVSGLGHAWSGGDSRHPFNDAQGPAASELIWEFLAAHRR